MFYIIAISILLLTNCNVPMEKYEWFPAASAPTNYPVEIYNGAFYTPSGDTIGLPSGKIFNNGWGKANSTRLVGEDLKELPSRLDVLWFSYTENKFYLVSTVLPYDKMVQLFKEGFSAPSTHNHITYNKIILGMAPTGTVQLWVEGQGVTTEIANIQGKQVDLPWNNFFPEADPSRDQFVQENLEELLKPEDLKKLKTEGVPQGLWVRYNNAFLYSPQLVSNVQVKDLWLNYFNGEREYLGLANGATAIKKHRALPQSVQLRWQNTKGDHYSSVINFNEEEIFAAFEKIKLEEQGGDIQLQFLIGDSLPAVQTNLVNSKSILNLTKTDIQLYSN